MINPIRLPHTDAELREIANLRASWGQPTTARIAEELLELRAEAAQQRAALDLAGKAIAVHNAIALEVTGGYEGKTEHMDWQGVWEQVADLGERMRELTAERDKALAALAAIKAADPDLFDPTGGTNRGAAYETYGSRGHRLREAYCAAVGINLGDHDGADDE